MHDGEMGGTTRSDILKKMLFRISILALLELCQNLPNDRYRFP